MKNIITTLLICVLGISTVQAKRSPRCKNPHSKSKIANFGKFAMPLGALGVSVVKLDWIGAGLSQGLAHGLYAVNKKVEHHVHKKRPCGCGGAFPSGHMIMYSTSASYLHYRYGWQYGLPAYIAMLGFSYDRVRNKAHSWGDMLGTAAIANVITYLITPRFTPDVEYLPHWGQEKKPAKPPEHAMQISPIISAQNNSYMAGFTVRI